MNTKELVKWIIILAIVAIIAMYAKNRYFTKPPIVEKKRTVRKEVNP